MFGNARLLPTYPCERDPSHARHCLVSPFRLLDLPTELWVKIARLALHDHPKIDVDSFFPPLQGYDPKRRAQYQERARALYQQPALARTCHTLRNELLPWIYTTTVDILIPDSKGVWHLEQIGSWLRMIGRENRKHVTEMRMLSSKRSLRDSNQVQDVARAWEGIEYRFCEPESFKAGEEELLRDCNWKYYKWITRVEFV
ncbi:uncharacterized protein RCC_03749 [Ramularia collo-cygni]|uniref:Uncharacterized protein n=1 Tax=Ramularia collo-cygni TaxID=112498 RepID=A0A2D3UNV5_9PEZI|nr:uncharacterized protein RCC_03749 [Ramularia collo-cygni]CZT17912.1 uncharacterized protein RCC_03749 [Ramularia collo-cygni]